jgi:RimJ/RimL family protein N-acetyltransferase
MQEHSPPVSVPRLRTPRLHLREYRVSDFDAFAAHNADPRATALTGARDRRTALWLFSSNMGEWLLKGAGWWAIELRGSGTPVGTVGAFFRETWPEIEMGWNTFSAYWGQGIATEAATEVVRYLFEVRQEPRITALITAENTASLRVAAHLGMTYESDADFFGKPVQRHVRSAGA